MQYCSDSTTNFKKNNYAAVVKNIFTLLDHSHLWNNRHLTLTKSVTPKTLLSKLHALYDDSWNHALLFSKKLRTYRQIKEKFKMENYLLFLPTVSRVNMTKLRISSHCLEIEKGRHKYPRVPSDKRFCKTCESEVEDEYHVIMECSKLKLPRQNTFKNIQLISDITNISDNYEKFIFVMKNGAIDTDFGRALAPLVNEALSST